MVLWTASVVEKPKADVAPSNLAVVGRYVLSAEIWPLLAKRLRERVMKSS